MVGLRSPRVRSASWIGIAAALTLTLVPIVMATTTAPRSGASSLAFGSSALGHCAVGLSDVYPAYDPVTHDVYVPNHGAGNLSVLSGCTVVGTITFPAGSGPTAAAFDPANNRIYVTDNYLNQVYAILGTKVVATIGGGHFNSPYGVAYDPGDAVIAVANEGWSNVTFISSANLYFGTNTVGTSPLNLAYDPFWGRLLVTDWNSNNVTSMDAIFPTDQSRNINIAVGTNPVGVAFDYANDNDYVTNPNSNNVSVFCGVCQSGTSISIKGGPQGIIWDQAKLAMYVTANPPSHPAKIDVIQGTTIVRNVTAPSTSIVFVGMAYDDATDHVYVADDGGFIYIYA